MYDAKQRQHFFLFKSTGNSPYKMVLSVIKKMAKASSEQRY